MALSAWRPPPLGPDTEAPGSAATTSIESAVADLYRACHLPPPAVVVARDAVQFARLASRLGPVSGFRTFFSLLCLALLLVAFSLAVQADAVGAAYCGFLAIFGVPGARAIDRPGHGTTGELKRVGQLLLAALVTGAAITGLSLLGGYSWHDALLASGTTLGGLACLQLLSNLLAPVWSRLRLRRENVTAGSRLGWWAVLRGGTPARPVLLPRLAAALSESGAAGAAGPQPVGPNWLGRGEVEWRLREAIESELHRLGCPAEFVPVLGHSGGRSFEPGTQVSALAAAGVDQAGLPRLLRAAVALDHLVEAVSVFHGAALVLPRGAPPQLVPAPAPPSRWRRSRQAPWSAALPWFDDPAGLALALDLAPTDGLADRLLAHRLQRLPEARRRTPAIQAFGMARFMVALRSRPMQEDSYGRLYLIGRREDPSTFVAIRDRVLAPGGTPLEHWISVPPHVATAREAVAWSFGMNEAEYRPQRET